jgi:hypothetical protein
MDAYVTDCGIPGIGKVPWGNHLCQFFQTGEDLVESLVPYFQTGLLQDERCIWGTAEPLGVDHAKAALAKEIPDLDRYLREDRIVIFDHQEWYRNCDQDPVPVLLEEERKALARGLAGLRTSGNCSWIESEDRGPFLDYEGRISRAIRDRRVLAVCNYDLGKGHAVGVLDAMRRHDYTLSKGEYGWELVERLRRM